MINKPVMFVIFELTQTPQGVEAFTWMSPDWKMLAEDAKRKVLTVISGETHIYKVYHPRYATEKMVKAVSDYAERIIQEQVAINAKRPLSNRRKLS